LKLVLCLMVALVAASTFEGRWYGRTDGFREVWIIGSEPVPSIRFEWRRGSHLAGSGIASNVRVDERGHLSFTQHIEHKPDPSWPDSNEFSDVWVTGDTLNFRHRFGSGSVTREQGKRR